MDNNVNISTDQNKRNLYLDLLRGFAAISVVLFHYTTRYEQLFGHTFILPISFPYGAQGVSLLFLISGYFAIYHVNKTNALTYWVKRFFKLYPVYWGAIILIYPLTVVFLPSRSVSLCEAIINFTMVQGFIGISSVDGAFWTLQLEMLFYFFVWVIILLKLNKHIDLLCIAWIVVRIILLILPDVLLVNYFRKAFSYFCMGDSYGHTIISGAIIQCIERRLKISEYKNRNNRVWISILTVCLLSCIWIQFMIHGKNSGIIFMVFIILTIISIKLHTEKILPPKPIMVLMKPILFIASVSYPLYLVHQNIGYIIIMNLEQIGIKTEFMLLVPMGMVIALAYLLNRFVEKPCALLCKRVCKQINKE